MEPRKLLIGVVVLAVIGIVFYTRFQDREADSAAARAAVHSFLIAMPCYGAHADAIDRLEATAHQDAFDAAYSVGKRGNRFDPEAYCDRFWEVMHAEAGALNDPEIATQLKACEREFRGAQTAGRAEA